MDGGGDLRRITIHGQEDFAGMRAAGRLAAETLDMIAKHVRPGVTTGQLDRLCHEFIVSHGAVPAPLNYRGYPKSICTSINHVVCHGIPSDRRLEPGDVLNIDVTVILNGWHGDTSRMFCAGPASTRARNLIEVTYEAMLRGVQAVKPGATLGDIGYEIQSFVESHRFSVVRDFCGHGIGRQGMTLAIEPMVNYGKEKVFTLQDNWTVVTADKSPSAHFEHTVVITSDGPVILTLP
jgi:methionyl aminopeptidase